MSHPYHHAISSVQEFGGNTDNYLAIHSWFDATKAHAADFRHRALRHHTLGLEWACREFGDEIKINDQRYVSVMEIGIQHLREDCGNCLPTVDQWFENASNVIDFDASTTALEHANRDVKRHGGQIDDYLPIHEWIDVANGELNHHRYRALRHHCLGAFECEQCFGPLVRNSEDRYIPTRLLAECHVRGDCNKYIPTVSDWIKGIRLHPWMMKARLLHPIP